MESEQQKFLIQSIPNVKYSIETKFSTPEKKLIIESILITKLVSLNEFLNMGLNQQKFFVNNIDNFLQGNYSIEKSNNEFTFKKCDVPIMDQEITDMSVI